MNEAARTLSIDAVINGESVQAEVTARQNLNFCRCTGYQAIVDAVQEQHALAVHTACFQGEAGALQCNGRARHVAAPALQLPLLGMAKVSWWSTGSVSGRAQSRTK